MSDAVFPFGSDARSAVKRLAESFALPRLQPGWVWLAGAGPGDPGLASLHTLCAIAEADVILVDALINPQLLSLARREAEIVDSGKRAGKASPKQETISQQLVSYARKGLRVLRLKGGDPFVFGRGAEEALALVRAGVPFRIVPGVTAGIGGLAYAGIPATHRDTNQAVTFVTGSTARGEAPDLDWAAIAKGSPTIVLYMARKHAGAIASQLIAAGRNPNEPAAIVSNASLEGQSSIVTTLAKLGEAAGSANPPSIMVIGENVRLAAGLDWLGAALTGKKLDPDPLGREPLSDAG
uniref:uroporphyrinogen-III C-methyltransferase n=1 Tax=uncultured bacterium BLR7 TaxID=506523 RepID=C0INN2_9BACT|nr:uroporphyrinogen-III methyltransferase [uncultured bacterium BLR7]